MAEVPSESEGLWTRIAKLGAEDSGSQLRLTVNSPPPCSPALGRLPDVHLHQGGKESGSDQPPTQMLVSFTNTVTDTPGRDAEPSSGESLSPVK